MDVNWVDFDDLIFAYAVAVFSLMASSLGDRGWFPLAHFLQAVDAGVAGVNVHFTLSHQWRSHVDVSPGGHPGP